MSLKSLQSLWAAVRSNPVFVTVSSAAAGAVVSGLQDELASGHVDFTRTGWNKLMGYAFTAAIAALAHLYRPAPSQAVASITQVAPNTVTVEVPGTMPGEPTGAPVAEATFPINPEPKK